MDYVLDRPRCIGKLKNGRQCKTRKLYLNQLCEKHYVVIMHDIELPNKAPKIINPPRAYIKKITFGGIKKRRSEYFTRCNYSRNNKIKHTRLKIEIKDTNTEVVADSSYKCQTVNVNIC